MAVSTWNDEREPASRVRYVVLVWFCAAAVIAYMQRNAISVASDEIRHDFGLSEQQMGWVLSAFFWAYALSQFPAGWMGNRWGTRRMLTLYSLASAVMTLLVASAGQLGGLFGSSLLAVGLLIAGRVGSGVAQAGYFPCCANSISKWYPPAQRALPSGFLGSSMSIGAVLAGVLTGGLLAFIRWDAVFLLFAIPGLIWAAGFFVWFRDRPDEHRSVNSAELRFIRSEAETSSPSEEIEESPEAGHDDADVESDALAEERSQEPPAESLPWRQLLVSLQMYLVCGQQFFRAAGHVFYITWFPTFLKETRGVTTLESGIFSSLPLLAAALGGLVGGPFADWVQVQTGNRRLSRQLIGACSQFGCGAMVLWAQFTADPLQAVSIISLGMFLFSFGSCAAYTVTIDLAGNHVATVFSIMNMAGNLGAAVCPVVVGMLIPVIGWEGMLWFFAGVYAAAGLCWTFLNPEGTLFDDKTV